MKRTQIYVIGGGDENPVKIGLSVHPDKRCNAVQTGCPFEVSVLHAQPVDRAHAVEAAVHYALAEKRATGEWFRVTPKEAVAAISEAVSLVATGWRAPKGAVRVLSSRQKNGYAAALSAGRGGRPKKLNALDIECARIDWCDARLTAEEVARRHSVSILTLRRELGKRGVMPKAGPKPKLVGERRAAAEADWKARNGSQHEITQRHGVSVLTMRREFGSWTKSE